MIVKGKLKVSTSALKTYEKCPREYYYKYIEKPEVEKKDWAHLRIGNFAHAVLDDFHSKLKENPSQPWPELMSFLCKEKVTSYNLNKDEKKVVKEMLNGYLTKLQHEGLPNVIATEKSFSIALDENTIIKGVIDRIDDETESQDIPKYHIKDYKGLALDTKIPTPFGWTTMELLKVGDQVFGSNGKPTNVIAKSKIHHRPCYKIEFEDKTEIVCDNVHIWPVTIITKSGLKNCNEILDADNLFEKFSSMKDSGYITIPNPDALDFSSIPLPINPWILGAWLGDGHSKTGSLTVGEEDLSDMLLKIKHVWGDVSISTEKNLILNKKNVYTVNLGKPNRNLCGYGHDMKTNAIIYNSGKQCAACCTSRKNKNRHYSKSDRTNVPLRNLLSKENLLLNKHIPKQYLYSSIDQRLELLRGLMDADGHWNKTRQQCVFVTSRLNLAQQVLELIRGLGVYANIFNVIDKNNNQSYQITFCPVDFNPFSLPRKAKAYEKCADSFSKTKKFNSKNRIIKNIKKVDSVPTQCISVDSEDKLYVCGEGMILSHNTGKSDYLDEFQLLVYGLYLLDNDPNLEKFKGSYTMLAEGSRSHMVSIFTKTDLDRVKEKIMKVANDIRSDQTWEPKPQFLCKFCDYNKICPSSPFKAASGGRKEW